MLLKKQLHLLIKDYYLLGALILCAVFAFFNIGYYHADEHYQIIEFAGLKSNQSFGRQELWEFSNELRSTIQPTFAYLIFKIYHLLTISNPFLQIFILKLISGFFAVFSIRYFINKTIHLVENKPLYKFLSYFLWFIPLISSRFSSETWGGITTLLALGYIQHHLINNKDNKPKVYFIIGILLGISFLFRFQMLFVSFGVFLWLILINKVKIISVLYLFLGGILVVFIGICIDCWFYGKLSLTFWNYLYHNIILDISSDFGISPWDYYFNKVWKTRFIGAVTIIAFFLHILRKPKSIFIWAIIPFILIHSIVGHKEFRFLFPLVYLVPLFITSGFDFLKTIKNPLIKHSRSALLFIFFGINTLFITFSLLKGEDDNGRHTLVEYFYENYQDKPIHIISTRYSSPYSPFGAPAFFYLTDNIAETEISTICELNQNLIKPDRVNFFITRKVLHDTHPECNQMINNSGFQWIKQSISPSIENILVKFYNIDFSHEILDLYILM